MQFNSNLRLTHCPGSWILNSSFAVSALADLETDRSGMKTEANPEKTLTEGHRQVIVCPLPHHTVITTKTTPLPVPRCPVHERRHLETIPVSLRAEQGPGASVGVLMM